VITIAKRPFDQRLDVERCAPLLGGHRCQRRRKRTVGGGNVAGGAISEDAERCAPDVVGAAIARDLDRIFAALRL
jgi:hypothetical protein